MKDRIKKIRKELDLTQQEFADKIGVKRGAIANYEIGRNEPVDSVVSLICRTFNVNEEWLRYGTGDMFLPEPSSEIDALARKYNMSKGEKIFLEKYFTLSDDERRAVSKLLDELTEEARRESAAEAARETEIYPSEAEIDRRMESLLDEQLFNARLERKSDFSQRNTIKK